VRLYDIHAGHRFPRVQDGVSSGRLVTWARASAGQRDGTSGTTIGQAPLTWACAEAAVLCLSDHPAAQTYLARLEKKPEKGTARTRRAQTLARAVSHRLTRQVAGERERCFQRAGRGAAEPGASLDTQGMHLQQALACAFCTASVTATAPMRSRDPEPGAVMGPPLSLLCVAALVANGRRGLLLTRAGCSLDNATRCARSLPRTVGGPREVSRSQSTPPTRLCTRRSGGESTSRRVWCSHVGAAPSYGHHVSPPDRLLTAPRTPRRKKSKKSARRGSVSLDTWGPHMGSAKDMA
jgi:hypothetical protein